MADELAEALNERDHLRRQRDRLHEWAAQRGHDADCKKAEDAACTCGLDKALADEPCEWPRVYREMCLVRFALKAGDPIKMMVLTNDAFDTWMTGEPPEGYAVCELVGEVRVEMPW